jgi:glycosyltransferase involved in cell wall biosynthesis/2-polyprenyl-3-methyl-5-hydroxy-6-metoxy-1,4-benzoquinol methylase
LTLSFAPGVSIMPRIGVVVVAYNAAGTLARVLDRIPADFRARIDGIYIGDNHSEDSTYLVGLGYQQVFGDVPLTVVRHPENLGYGGNQQAGYRWAIDNEFDIVVLLHADGQYAPEFLPEIVRPLEDGEADAVFGSRMMSRGDARRGGMPLYKIVGNTILTTAQNAVVGESLSEWHSGYRAYSVATLAELPFERLTGDYNFDTQIILQLHEAKKRIVELPIPTFYGEEISYVNGMKYARQCAIDVMRYRAHKMGLGSGEMAFNTDFEQFDDEDVEHVHRRVLTWFDGRPSCRVLDLACGDGALGERLRAMGHTVVGVAPVKHDGVGARLDRFVEADLEAGLPSDVGDDFDVVVGIDVVGQVRDPESLLGDVSARMRRGGALLVSVPNFGHWYPRLRVASGRFDYDRRGILDRDQLRFFTEASARRCFDAAGLTVRQVEPVGLPVNLLAHRSSGERRTTRSRRALQRIDGVGRDVRPTLFAYQWLFELEPVAPDA